MGYLDESQEILRLYRSTKDSDLLYDLYQVNKGLFYKISIKYQSFSDMEDLMQECYFALVKAVETYDQSKADFHVYLSSVVKWHLFQYVNNTMITIPVYLQILCYKYRALKEKGCSDRSISQRLQLTSDKLDQVKKAAVLQSVRSLDAPITDDDMTLADVVADQGEQTEDIINTVFHEELTQAIEDAALTEREKQYLFMRYFEDKTYKEIDYSHSDNNTKRIIDKALRKLSKNPVIIRFYEESNLYCCNNMTYFKRTHTSGVERAVMRLLE